MGYFEDNETIQDFHDDGPESFKLGSCPWKNNYCEYVVSVTYRSFDTKTDIIKYYCAVGTWKHEDKCPIQL